MSTIAQSETTCHVAPDAILARDVNARDYAYIGSGTIVRPGITNTEVGTRWSRFGCS
jgi:hypothetical protein